MQAANKLQKALTKGGPTFGTWQMLPGTNIARLMARSGVDWICVDTEHGNLDDAQMHESVTAIAACGVSPVVRIPANDGWMVKRALDTGAHGIVVPLLRTPAEATALVQAAKFPPRGIRGFGSPFSHGTLGLGSQAEYLVQANEALLTIVQIETREALMNVDAIAKVDGIDVLFIGPFDLGNSIGHPILDGTMHEALKDAIDVILKAAVDNGKRAGIYCTSGQQALEYSDKGFHMICVASDVSAVSGWVSQELGTAKGSLAHSTYNVAKGAVAGAAKMATSKDK